jgi:hypothetical protein
VPHREDLAVEAASEQFKRAAQQIEHTGADPDDSEHGECRPEETRAGRPAAPAIAAVRPWRQSRAQEPPEREALDGEPKPFDEQYRPDRELEYRDRPAGREKQTEVEDDERERDESAEPGDEHRPYQRGRGGGRRIERRA